MVAAELLCSMHNSIVYTHTHTHTHTHEIFHIHVHVHVHMDYISVQEYSPRLLIKHGR